MAEAERKKRSITEIRDSKKTGEKMVYMSVPDYTSARWAEAAGVDVAVVGDSLAMVAHGHPNTVPATMEMMVMHCQYVKEVKEGTFPADEHCYTVKDEVYEQFVAQLK